MFVPAKLSQQALGIQDDPSQSTTRLIFTRLGLVEDSMRDNTAADICLIVALSCQKHTKRSFPLLSCLITYHT